MIMKKMIAVLLIPATFMATIPVMKRSGKSFAAQQALLGCEHFEIIGLTVIHQFVSAHIGLAQHFDLSVIVAMLLAGSLTVG